MLPCKCENCIMIDAQDPLQGCGYIESTLDSLVFNGYAIVDLEVFQDILCKAGFGERSIALQPYVDKAKVGFNWFYSTDSLK